MESEVMKDSVKLRRGMAKYSNGVDKSNNAMESEVMKDSVKLRRGMAKCSNGVD